MQLSAPPPLSCPNVPLPHALGQQSADRFGAEEARAEPWFCVFPEREGGQVTGDTTQDSGACWSLRNVRAQRARVTAASAGSVPPGDALPARRRGRWVWAGRQPFPPSPAQRPCPQPAVGQTFLGLLIDIQEWNSSSSARRPERAGAQALGSH